MAALLYPPVADEFLAMFGLSASAVVWEGRGHWPRRQPGPRGIRTGGADPRPVCRRACSVRAARTPAPGASPADDEHRFAHRAAASHHPRGRARPRPGGAARPTDHDPPRCVHMVATIKRFVSRRDSPNIGRAFYVCAQQSEQPHRLPPPTAVRSSAGPTRPTCTPTCGHERRCRVTRWCRPLRPWTQRSSSKPGGPCSRERNGGTGCVPAAQAVAAHGGARLRARDRLKLWECTQHEFVRPGSRFW